MAITIDGTNGLTTDNAALKLDGTTLVVDEANDRVGIGTSSPQKKFVVSNAGAAGLEIDPFTRSATTGASLLAYNRSGSAFVRMDYDAEQHLFFTGSTERARIDSSGNLLVGTASATAFQNNNSLVVRAVGDSIQNHASGTVSGSGYVFFGYNGSGIGSITQNGTTSVAYNTSSDYRLKEDWQPMTGASERVQALKPVNFAWKVDGSRVDGFLAHEAQAIVPEAVTGAKDAVDAEGNPVYQGIDQSKLVPLLTAALQEALTKIDALTARVEALEGTT